MNTTPPRLHRLSSKPFSKFASGALPFARARAQACWIMAALLVCAVLAPSQRALAEAHRVGVLTANFTMTAFGAGNWFWGNPDWEGYSGNDAVQVSISGQVKYEVLGTETNLIVGALLNSTGQETVSGDESRDDWTWNNDGQGGYYITHTPGSVSYFADPNFNPTNTCLIVSSNNPSTQSAGTGLFLGASQRAPYGESWNLGGSTGESDGSDENGYSSWGVFYPDYFLTRPPDQWGYASFGGQGCTSFGQYEVQFFQFAIANAGLPWTQTLTTNVTLHFTESDSTGSSAANGGASRTVTLEYLPDNPTLDYTVTPTSGTAPLQVAFQAPFTDSLGNTITQYHWDFGDGTTEDTSLMLRWHTYTNAGDYTISMTCSNDVRQPVAASGPTAIHVSPPTIQFTANPTNGTARLTVSFTCPDKDSGGSAIQHWLWDFGDGATSTDQNPTHTYIRSGDYSIQLTVLNETGCLIDADGPTTISVGSPTVQFSAAPTLGVAPLTVYFNCPSVDSGGNLLNAWKWNFGDNKKDTTQSPQHVYKKAGKYFPTLVATNSDNNAVAGSGPCIEVASYLGLVLNGNFETGDFYGWTNSGPMNYSTVTGNNADAHSGACGAHLNGMFGSVSTLSQTLVTQPGTTYLLSFWLDNPPGNNANQAFVSWGGNIVWGATNLTAYGWTNVQVLVTASSAGTVLQFGFQAMMSFGLDDVDVESAYVSFTANPTAGGAPLTVQFTSPGVDNNGKTVNGWAWDFGDDTTGTGPSPSHTYLTAGKFAPRFTATNSSGSAVVGIGPAIAVTLPSAQFTATPASGEVPLTVQFTGPSSDSSGHSVAQWNWDFGDGATSTNRSQTHTYTNGGAFIPTLTITNDSGVTLTATGPAIAVMVRSGLVLNGGFETGDFSGWTEGGNFGYCSVVAAGYVHSGKHGAQLGPLGSLGYLSQMLTTTPGQKYVLSFWLNSSSSGGNKEFSVSWNGTTLYDQTTIGAAGWTNMQFAVTATGTSTPLQFGFHNDSDYFGLDDISVVSPTVQFTASPTNGQMPLVVHFTSPPADSSGSSLTRWNWDFGDGTTSTVSSPTHTYLNGGRFSPTLTVTNQAGLGIIASGPTISAEPPPTVQFTASPVIGAAPLLVQFSCPSLDSNGNLITGWHWDFGDGATSAASSPTHIYASHGTFSASLVATNAKTQMVSGSGPAVVAASLSGLVTNGDFETGDLYAWSKGGTMNYSSVNGSSQLVHSGGYGVSLGGMFGSVSTVSQTLTTTPGAHYRLSCWLNNPGGSPNLFFVSWGGNTVWGVTNVTATGWTNIQLTLNATQPGTVLQFGFEHTTYFGLDDVSVLPLALPQPGFAHIRCSGKDLLIDATNGVAGANVCVLTSTNPASPLNQWTPVATNTLSSGGNFSITATNAVDPATPQRFYKLQVGWP